MSFVTPQPHYLQQPFTDQGPHKDGWHGWHATRQFSMPPVKFQAITIVATRQFLTTLIVATRQFLTTLIVATRQLKFIARVL